MSEPWVTILEQLRKRDQAQNRDADYIKAFEQLAHLNAAATHPEKNWLTKENSHLHEETESLMTRLNLQTMKLESAHLRVKELTKALAEKDAKINKLNLKVSGISDALAEKNKLFEVMNDEQLITQIQQNVLRERISELERKYNIK